MTWYDFLFCLPDINIINSVVNVIDLKGSDVSQFVIYKVEDNVILNMRINALILHLLVVEVLL